MFAEHTREHLNARPNWRDSIVVDDDNTSNPKKKKIEMEKKNVDRESKNNRHGTVSEHLIM